MGSKNKNDKKQKSKAERPDGAAAVEVAQNNGGGRGGKVITDPRFASVHSDPRFREAPRQKTKVAIDSRFTRMYTDKNFTSSKAVIDKRGKQKKDKDASQNKLKHYYRLEEEEEKENEREKEDDLKKKKHIESEEEEEESEKEESESEESGSEESESEIQNSKKKASKVNNEFESESEEEEEEEDDEEGEEEEHEIDDSSSTSTTDSDEEDGAYSEEEDTFMQVEENVPEIDKETHRLAVVNMDWSHMKAVDLYVLLSSFLPKEGQIKSVTVYPSEFGLKRMEEEAVRGPVGLFDDDKEDDEDDEDDDDEIDEKKLRAYELSKLRYYFAVVDCDSIATADYLYKTCDGVEVERSANTLDLRFIPDSMEFKHQPRDVATEVPADYDGLNFETRALQQSKVEISWDEDEPQRVMTLKRNFNDDQLADLELKEFLASDESETDGDDEIDNDGEEKADKNHKKQDRYRALLESGNGSDGSDEEDDEGGDMEVTFNTGLEDLSKRILEKKDRKSETVWEAQQRKWSEKKKARKNKSKGSSDDEGSDTDEEPAVQPDDFFVEEEEEPTAKRSSKRAGKTTQQKGKQNVEAIEENEASKAELELLFADDDGGADPGLKGYNMKRKKTKGKKGKEVQDEEKIPVADCNDPRFSSLFTSPLFAMDPTDPQFKRSATYARQLAQKHQKSDMETVSELPPAEITTKSEDRDEHGDLPSKSQNYELSSLVRSIKMKSKQVPLPPTGKKSGSQPATKKRKQRS